MEINDSSPEIVEALLEFMSKGQIPSDIDISMELIQKADLYGLDLLTKACVASMVKNLSSDNALEVLIIVDKLNYVPKPEHRQKIVAFIKKEANQVAKSNDWERFLQNYPSLVTEIFLSACKS